MILAQADYRNGWQEAFGRERLVMLNLSCEEDYELSGGRASGHREERRARLGPIGRYHWRNRQTRMETIADATSKRVFGSGTVMAIIWSAITA